MGGRPIYSATPVRAIVYFLKPLSYFSHYKTEVDLTNRRKLEVVLIYFLSLCLWFLTSDNSHYFPFRHNFPDKSNQKTTKWKVLNVSLSPLLFSESLLTAFPWTWPRSSFLYLETIISYSYGCHAVPKYSYGTECSNPRQPQLLQHAVSVVQEPGLVFPTGCFRSHLEDPSCLPCPKLNFRPFKHISGNRPFTPFLGTPLPLTSKMTEH